MDRKNICLFIFVILLHISASQEKTTKDSTSSRSDESNDVIIVPVPNENLRDSALDSDLEKKYTNLSEAIIDRDAKRLDYSNELITTTTPDNIHFLPSDPKNHGEEETQNLGNHPLSEELITDPNSNENLYLLNSESLETSKEEENSGRSGNEEFKDKQLLVGLMSYPHVPEYNQVDNHRDSGFMPAPEITSHNFFLPQQQAILRRNMLMNTQRGLRQHKVPSAIDPYPSSNWVPNTMTPKYGKQSKSGTADRDTRLIEDYHDFSGNSYVYRGKKTEFVHATNQDSGPNNHVLQKLHEASYMPFQAGMVFPSSFDDGAKQDSKIGFHPNFRYPHYSHVY